MADQVKYGARPEQVAKTASGQPGTKDVKLPKPPPEKDKKP